MKKVLIALMSAALLGGMSSCTKWLDVETDTHVSESQMFETSAGMRIALNGIYSSLGEPSLYGQNLTWGLVSVLSRDYKNANLPSSYKDGTLITKDGEWSERYAFPIVDPIWTKAYNTLANVNNLLQAVEKAPESLFTEYPTLERNLFMAELRGLRALIHFDLLRLFAPAPIKDDGKAHMPYVEKFPEYQPKKLTVNEVMEKIEADFLYSAKLLADIDTMGSAGETEFTCSPYRTYSGDSRFKTSYNSSNAKGAWYAMGGTRINYPAVTALLVRFYMWKGDKQAAVDASQYLRYKSWYAMSSTNNWQSNKNSRKLYKDILFAAYNTDLPQNFADVNKNKNFRYDDKVFKALYANDKDDYRGVLMIDETNNYAPARWVQPAKSTTDSQTEDPLAPVIRLSEVYLALIECYADTDLEKAIKTLSDLRIRRNAKSQMNITTKEELLEELEREYMRELQSEGQRFYYYKRLGKAVYQGDDVERYDFNLTNCWVLKRPIKEDDYSL